MAPDTPSPTALRPTQDIDRLQGELAALEQKARELSACLKAMTLVGSSLNLDEVLDRAITSATEVMNAEVASILLRDDKTGELSFKLATGDAAESLREIRIPRGQGIAGHVAEKGESIVVEDARSDPRFFRGADDKSGFVTRSILAVPLRVKDRIIGVAEAINKRGGNFSESDLPLFTAYASLAAVAIENAKMHQDLLQQEVLAREINIATQIQSGLQGPSEAALGRVRFAGLSQPARSVGGDFFDWIDLGDGRALFAVGDVSGKGIPAALLMANTLSRLRADALRLVEPELILTSINASLAATAQRGLFVTIFLALIEDDGSMTYSTAGHPLPMYLSGSRFLELPDINCPPVAILPHVPYRQVSMQLQEGDLLVLFTDGVTEAVSTEGEFFGFSRLQSTIRAGVNDPKAIPERIRSTVLDFEAGRERSDDLTVAAVAFGERRPELFLDFKHLGPDNLGAIRSSFEAFLLACAADDRARSHLVLAMDEACANVIRHSYEGAGGPASIACRLDGDTVECEITDSGCGRIPSIPEGDPGELRPGGLGLRILRDAMDEVRFEAGPSGGCVLRMNKKLAGNPDAQ